jgi:hypothetical protein
MIREQEHTSTTHRETSLARFKPFEPEALLSRVRATFRRSLRGVAAVAE